MQVLMGKKVRKVLANASARQQLAKAITQSTRQRATAPAKIVIDGKTYVLKQKTR